MKTGESLTSIKYKPWHAFEFELGTFRFVRFFYFIFFHLVSFLPDSHKSNFLNFENLRRRGSVLVWLETDYQLTGIVLVWPFKSTKERFRNYNMISQSHSSYIELLNKKAETKDYSSNARHGTLAFIHFKWQISYHISSNKPLSQFKSFISNGCQR